MPLYQNTCIEHRWQVGVEAKLALKTDWLQEQRMIILVFEKVGLREHECPLGSQIIPVDPSRVNIAAATANHNAEPWNSRLLFFLLFLTFRLILDHLSASAHFFHLLGLGLLRSVFLLDVYL